MIDMTVGRDDRSQTGGVNSGAVEKHEDVAPAAALNPASIDEGRFTGVEEQV